VVSARDILPGWADIKAWQADVDRTLHAHPELPDQEFETAALAAETLRSAGFEVREEVGSTGVIGGNRSLRSGRAVG
jgi:hippurate hydrolase